MFEDKIIYILTPKTALNASGLITDVNARLKSHQIAIQIYHIVSYCIISYQIISDHLEDRQCVLKIVYIFKNISISH